ncbi:hypothetical protein [Thermococcus sp. ES12]|uniref:hypothetical protein n=1 Tax=Thermococcus sp. ES12 TaxID=1638246 RepID=UPI00352D86FE
MGEVETWQIASYLAMALGALYIALNLRAKGKKNAGRLSMLFTAGMGAYLITLGLFSILVREGRISSTIYAAMIWAFTLALIPMALYMMAKRGTRASA